MLPKIRAKYIAKAIASAFGVSSNGNYEIGITCEVVDGEHAGQEITWIGFFSEKTQERTIESLQHFGWKGDNLEELADLDAEGCARMFPDHVELACDVEVYEGEQQLKVKWVNKPGAGRFAFKDKLEGGQLKSFAAQMRGAIRGAQQAGPRKPNAGAPKSTHPNAPGNGDDIPFASCDIGHEPSPIARVLR